MTVITDMSADDYTDLLGQVCPYCAASLPVATGGTGSILHFIPNASETFPCQSQKLRVLRGEKIQSQADAAQASQVAQAATLSKAEVKS